MEQQVTLELTVTELNVIIKGLLELPAKESMNMIGKIQQEANAQIAANEPEVLIDEEGA